MSKQVVLDLPEGAFSALRSEPAELGRELRLAAAVKWYEMRLVSQGRAAEIAGLSRAAFLEALNRFGVSALQYSAEEVTEEAKRG